MVHASRQALAVLVVGAALLLFAPIIGHAQSEGSLTGTVSLASPSQRGEAPTRNRGFLRRSRNPLKSPKASNPLPDIVVVLEGGPSAKGSKVPPRRYKFIGESFERNILPVSVGGVLEIENASKRSPLLVTPGQSDLLKGDPINPKGVRSLKLKDAYKPVSVKETSSVHVQAKLLGIPHNYFATVSKDGSFSISDVPAGTWKVRIWYRDGWLKRKDAKVDIKAKRSTKTKIKLPAKLKVAKR